MHTPGPWQRNIPPATKYTTVFVGRNTHIMDVLPSRGIPADQAEANLNLVVAAPDMLEALRLALADKAEQYRDTFDSRMDVDPTVAAIRDAIAKAEGRRS